VAKTTITEIEYQRIDARDGRVLLVHPRDKLSGMQRLHVMQQMRAAFPDNPILILDAGLEVRLVPEVASEAASVDLPADLDFEDEGQGE